MKNEHNELVGSDIKRSDDRIDLNGEVFTPMKLCVEMVEEIPLNTRTNPDSTFLDPSAGNGNFLVALVFFRCTYHSIKIPPVQGVVTDI